MRYRKQRPKPVRRCIAPGTLDAIRAALGKPTRPEPPKPLERPPGRDSNGEEGFFAARGR